MSPFLTGSALLFCVTEAYSEPPAKDVATPESLEESAPRTKYSLVVTASRQPSTVFDSARSASTVTQGQLERQPPRTTAEALRETEGVFVQQTGYSGGSAFVRGLTGQHVLLLVDGVRLNTTTTRTGPNGLLTLIDPYTIQAIDVVRGPGSVLYGSDAIGGVIQVRTRAPHPEAGSAPQVSLGARGAAASFDGSFEGSARLGGRWRRFAVESTFSARSFSDLLTGRGIVQPMTAYSEGGLSLGIGADVGAGSVVAVYQGVRQYDAVRNDRSLPGDLRVSPETARDLLYVRYEGRPRPRADKEPLRVHATLWYQRQRELLDRLRVLLDRRDHDDNAVDVLGLTAYAGVPLGRAGLLTAGIDGTAEWISSSSGYGAISEGPGARLIDQSARYPDGSQAQALALFVQDELDLERLVGRGNPQRPRRLSALVALRGGGSFLAIPEDKRLAALFPLLGDRGVIAARHEANLVYAGSLNLRYEPLSGLAFLGGLLTGYRAPNLADYARLGYEGLGYVGPAVGLHPEAAYSGELGVRTARRVVEASAFYSYTLINGVLAATPTPVAGQECIPAANGSCSERFYGRENADQARFHAVEFMARLYLGAVSLVGTLSYVHGTLDRSASALHPASSKPFYKIPPLHGFGALQLYRPRAVLELAEFSVRWAAQQDRLGDADLDDPRVCPRGPPCAGTPGFYVLAVRSAVRLGRHLRLTAQLENLADISYRVHGSGINGPGLGARLTFDANY